MAALIPTLAGFAKGLTLTKTLALAGTAVSGIGALQAGNAQNANAKFQAKQLEAQGAAERASATLKAEQEGKQKRLVLSRARAVGAASGGGQDINLLGQIEEEGTYRTLAALWEGEEAAKGRNTQAAAARAEGKQYKRAGLVRGAAGLFGGASLYEKYG